MNRTTTRLSSVALAALMTFAMLSGINQIAVQEAAVAAPAAMAAAHAAPRA
jgi:hypothetical protein